MRKNSTLKYITIMLMLIAFIFIIFAPTVSAASSLIDVSTEFPDYKEGGEITEVKNVANSVWGSVILIVRILAFSAIIFAGIRYMFASADQRADIKKGLIYLVIGSILVFSASTVVSIVLDATGGQVQSGNSSK